MSVSIFSLEKKGTANVLVQYFPFHLAKRAASRIDKLRVYVGFFPALLFAMIKKKNNSSYIRKFRGIGCKVIYD
jgi:hypothetical protein